MGNLGELRIWSVDGDIRLTWNAGNADEVAIAERTFDEKRKEGFLATKTPHVVGSPTHIIFFPFNLGSCGFLKVLPSLEIVGRVILFFIFAPFRTVFI